VLSRLTALKVCSPQFSVVSNFPEAGGKLERSDAILAAQCRLEANTPPEIRKLISLGGDIPRNLAP
jgi:hypothetical protein